MSQRDKDLLRMANLSNAQAGEFLSRRRQSMHAGIEKDTDYFGIPELAAIVSYAKRSDSALYSQILDYIEGNYSELFQKVLLRDLVSPRRAAFHQLLNHCAGSQQLLVLCNETRVHLEANAVFAKVLVRLLRDHAERVHLLAPNPDWLKYLALRYRCEPVATYRYSRDFWLPSAPSIIGIRNRALRGFSFGRYEMQEIAVMDAYRLLVIARAAGVPDDIELDQTELREKESVGTQFRFKEFDREWRS